VQKERRRRKERKKVGKEESRIDQPASVVFMYVCMYCGMIAVYSVVV